MKKAWAWALCLAFGLSLIPALMLTAADTVAFSLSRYREAYARYGRPEATGIAMDDLMDVTDRLLGYMKGRAPDIVIEKPVAGEIREVFGERERRHMEDVRALVLAAVRIRAALFAAAALSLAGIAAWKRRSAADWLSRGYLVALAAWGILLGALAVYMLADFSGAFWNFHLLLFDNDLWLLDPGSSVMINMFPEEFFNGMALAIAGRAALCIVLPAAAAAVWLIRGKTRARGR